MITLLLSFAILFQIIFIIKLIKKQKHDKVLYGFCQTRRDVMKYLRDNYENLSDKDYSDIKVLISPLNASIHDFNYHKYKSFNLRKIEKLMRQTKHDVQTIRINFNNENIDIQKIQISFIGNYFNALWIYTPLIKLKFFRYILIRLFQDKIKEFINWYNDSVEWYFGETNKYRINPC